MLIAACLLGLVGFGLAWRRASARTLYRDTDNDPVSVRSAVGLLWLVCLVTLLMKVGSLLRGH